MSGRPLLAGSIGRDEDDRASADDWIHQSTLALAGLEQLDKQILSAEIRKSIAQNEFDNYDRQIATASEIDDFMQSSTSRRQS